MLKNRLEGELAESIAGHISAVEAGAFPQPGAELSWQLNLFLYWALREHDEWSRYRSVDGLKTDAVWVTSPTSVEFHGLLIWLDDLARNYVDPVYVEIRLAATLPQIDAYEVRVGDARTGVGLVGFGERSPREWSSTSEWLFEVSGREYPGEPDRTAGDARA